jgi:hypothetical protein
VLSGEGLTKVSDHKSLLWKMFERFGVGMIRRSDEFFDLPGRLQKYFNLVVSARQSVSARGFLFGNFF